MLPGPQSLFRHYVRPLLLVVRADYEHWLWIAELFGALLFFHVPTSMDWVSQNELIPEEATRLPDAVVPFKLKEEVGALERSGCSGARSQ